MSSFQKLRALVSDLIIFALNLYSNHIWVILHIYLLAYEPCTMSFEWDVKWCPVSRIITPLARKRQFHWISIKNRLVRAASETSKFQNLSHLTNSRRCYMAEMLPIRRKTPTIQSINQWTLYNNFNTARADIDYVIQCFYLNVLSRQIIMNCPSVVV